MPDSAAGDMKPSDRHTIPTIYKESTRDPSLSLWGKDVMTPVASVLIQFLLVMTQDPE